MIQQKDSGDNLGLWYVYQCVFCHSQTSRQRRHEVIEKWAAIYILGGLPALQPINDDSCHEDETGGDGFQ